LIKWWLVTHRQLTRILAQSPHLLREDAVAGAEAPALALELLIAGAEHFDLE